MRLFLPALFILACMSSFCQTGISIVTQHNNLNRTGWNDKETVLNHNSFSSGKFGCIGALSVDDQVYAQPLILNKITIGSYTGSVLYVATVNNTVYAFNANDISQGIPLWEINLNPPGQSTPNVSDLKDSNGGACEGNYRDFSGHFGIVGTPVIDTVSNTLYVATKTVDNNGIFYAYLNALDLKTGAHKAGSPHLMSAQVDGTGAGAVNGKVPYLPKYQNQRPALLLYKNTVYVASASYCDWGPYHGWILGFDAATLNLKYSYNTTPDGWAGGIWMAGQGISVGGDGNLYAVTGNGTTSPDNTKVSARSESLIKLTPQLAVLDWFTPANYDYLDQGDLDYGCDGALIIPNSTTTISGSKEGLSYVVDFNNMGRFNSMNQQVKDTLLFNRDTAGEVHIHGSPVYAKLGLNEFVYAWSESYKLRQFTFNRSTGTFLKSSKEGKRVLSNGMPGGMLSVSSKGGDTSSAIVWACFPTLGDANHQVRPGSFAAYPANDVSRGELWNSEQNFNDAVGNFAKFNYPLVANGKVFVPTFSKAIRVYGISCSTANFQFGSGNGLKGEYFSNSSSSSGFPLSGTVIQPDLSVNFNWGSGSPAPGVTPANFKARWTGKLRPLTDDTYTLYVTANDGVRLWINNILLIDSWTNKTITTNSGSIFLQKSTDYDIKIEYFSASKISSCILQWSAAGICKQNIPPSQLYPQTAKCSSNGSGLLAEYFTNAVSTTSFPSVATVKKTEPTINFNWGAGSPDGISNDQFEARFSGYVQSLDSGKYTFYLTADDGVRLWINNKLILDKWVDRAATEDSATINLPECTKNAIKLEYYERTGDAVCKLEWSGPTVGRQVIPTSQLFTDPDSVVITKDFAIYPNPNRIHSLTVSTTANLEQGGHVIIYNMLGQMLINNIIAPVGAQHGTVIIPFNLSRGIYVVKLFANNKTYSAKLLIL